jgi:adenylate cyclase class 2
MPHSTTETEIKLAVEDTRAARGMLRAAGFELHRRRVFEANTVFDTEDLRLRNSGLLLRIREAGKVCTLTYKGVTTPAKHKSREEQELIVPDAQVMSAILQGIGFHEAFRYEKYRTEYKQPGVRGIATMDETPVGVYLELEGPGAWIDRTARRLKFSELDYITASYGTLYRNWCEKRGVEPGDMVFAGEGQD